MNDKQITNRVSKEVYTKQEIKIQIEIVVQHNTFKSVCSEFEYSFKVANCGTKIIKICKVIL